MTRNPPPTEARPIAPPWRIEPIGPLDPQALAMLKRIALDEKRFKAWMFGAFAVPREILESGRDRTPIEPR